jgi:hypothetical protein
LSIKGLSTAIRLKATSAVTGLRVPGECVKT